MGRYSKTVVPSKTNRKTKKQILNYASVRSNSRIWHLPDEILLHIFSMLPQEIILSKASGVCKKWNLLTKDATLWRKINLNEQMPGKVAFKWISSVGPHLKDLVVKNRRDLSEILQKVSKKCNQLETIAAYNCHGSRKWLAVYSLTMCKLISKCRQLHCIHFHKTAFTSCKFFKLMTQPKFLKRGKICSYAGEINCKQLNAILGSLKQNEIATESVFVENGKKRYSMDQLEKQIGHSADGNQIDFGKAVLDII